MIDVTVAAREHLLALADDEHLMGQQHTEWIGVAPFLEEDLAFCSIAQDELGHAAALYELLSIDGDADALAYGRGAAEYRSCHLVELPCPDWAAALARHWLYDLAERRRWAALDGSVVPELAAIAQRVEREEEYHRRHATMLVERMLEADEPARTRLREAVAALAPMADGIWEPVSDEAAAVAAGVITAGSAELGGQWRTEVEAVVGPVDWDAAPRPDQQGRTVRSEHFAALLARITEVFALDPTARW